MKRLVLALTILLSGTTFAQDEFIRPLLINPSIYQHSLSTRASELNDLDSTFIYEFTPLELKYAWDDFSMDKFESFDADYTDAGVTSELFYRLMDETDITPQDPTLIFCDSAYAHHDTIKVESGIEVDRVRHYPFTPNNVFVNDLDFYPVVGELRSVFQECYVLVDSLIDGVLAPVQDTVFYNTQPGPAYVQDSARVFTKLVTDTNSLWVNDFACRNFTFAIEPWSLGVATFDGVDENGTPYDFGNESAYGVADYLTTRDIDLSGLAASDDLYLTFVYQMKGHGNLPENMDSLLLEFWDESSEIWSPVVAWKGMPEFLTPDVWDTARVAVPPILFDEKFKFRFKNYASLSGALDHWHIDYVTLEVDNIFPEIETFNDVAYSLPINTILKDYTQVPWDHYKANTTSSEHMLEDLEMKVYNSHIGPGGTNFTSGEWSVSYESILQGGSPFFIPNASSPSANFDFSATTVCTFTGADDYFFDPALGGDQAKFDVEFNFRSSAAVDRNITKINDTMRFAQKFRNFYAYDDGSAEAAYGVEGVGSLMAYKFDAYQGGLLTGVLMHFVPTVSDVSGEVFLLTVWADNEGVPGDIIYQDDYFESHSPEYSGSKDGFRYYTFNNETYLEGDFLPVDKVFYVGWQNISNESLNIGLDWNINNGDKVFRNTAGNWLSSSFDISLLIRPVFSTALDYTLSNQREEIANNQVENINLYPNPTTSQFTMTGLPSIFNVTVYDLSGRQVFATQNEETIDVSYLENGVYLVDVRDDSGVNIYTTKLIKK